MRNDYSNCGAIAIKSNKSLTFILKRMKIVVLDGYTVNPGDLSWDALKSLGECTIYDRTLPEQIVERAKDAEVLLTNKVVIDNDIMSNLPALKYIGVMATGYNIIDLKAAKERGIIVTNVPAYSTPSVGQMVFAHILNIIDNTSLPSLLTIKRLTAKVSSSLSQKKISCLHPVTHSFT